MVGISRRQLVTGGSGLAILAAFGGVSLFAGRGRAAEGSFPLTRTDEEWRASLTPDQYAVLRQEATEAPFTSALNDEHGVGTFHCAGCDQALFSSETKFDSGTGWPSFWQPLDRAVGTTTDYKLVYPRTEVHCANCGGHLGHVFEDGPEPTGLRYCMNGVAMTFRPGGAQPS